MTIDQLRAVARHHAEQGDNFRRAGHGMGSCPTAETFLIRAEQHAVWAAQLTQLADAFATFSQLSANQPSNEIKP